MPDISRPSKELTQKRPSCSDAIPELQTPRLLLRAWQENDLEDFAKLNRDPKVMRYLGPKMSSAESDNLVRRIQMHFDTYGFGLWAVERLDSGSFIGCVGIAVPSFEAHFTPCVEIGWRLACSHWGQGFATEAASKIVNFALGELGLAEIVSFTYQGNYASRRVMEKLDFTHDPKDNFLHPKLAPGNPLAPHVLYRKKATVNTSIT